MLATDQVAFVRSDHERSCQVVARGRRDLSPWLEERTEDMEWICNDSCWRKQEKMESRTEAALVKCWEELREGLGHCAQFTVLLWGKALKRPDVGNTDEIAVWGVGTNASMELAATERFSVNRLYPLRAIGSCPNRISVLTAFVKLILKTPSLCINAIN